MDTPVKQIHEDIKAYTDLRTRLQEEEKRLSGRLAELEKASHENYEIIASNNSDGAAQRRLEEVDAEIAELREELRSQRRRSASRLRTRRTKLLQAQEKVLSDLEESLRMKQDEHDDLRNTLIPEAEAHLATLRDHAEAAREEIKEIRHEIQEINRINLDDILQA